MKKILVFVLLGAAGISFGISGNVSALDKNTILTKAVYQGVYNCAKDGAYAKEFSLASSPNDFYANKKAYEIELPYYFTQFNYNTANCKQIMSGDGQGNTHGETRLKGLLPVKYVAFNWNAKEAVDYFTGASHDGVGGIGYKLKDGQVNDKGTLTGFNIEVVDPKDIPMDLIKGLNNNNGAGLKLTNVNSKTDLGLTQQETFDLFSYYLIDVFKVPFACEGDQNYNNYSGLKDEIKIGGKTCKYKLADAKSPASYVFGVNDQGFFSGKTDANAVFTNLKQMAESGTVKTDELGAVMAGADTSSGANGDSDNNDSEPTCEGSGAGKSLGWVLCPVLNIMSSAAESLYNFVAPYLKFNPKLLTEDDGGVSVAWETFRNMANVLFIILLLVVIFSQVTGVGIDNYGIKKILPKLIVAAVLINLSRLICLIFVDLSNILGNGLMGLFNGLPPLEVADSIEGTSWNASGWGLSFLSIGIITAFGAGALLAIISNPAILISLLVAALGIVISIFFLFVLLAAREALIVILVIISPLAFACMMMPNTKKLFNKWLKAGQGMLLLYPLIGLVMGGSNYVSRLLMTSEDGNVGFVSALVAMLVGIVPVFFIPSLLRSSFAAVGNLGSKVSSWGNKVGRRGASTIGKQIQDSNRFKAFQNEQVRKAQARSANRTIRRLGRKQNRTNLSDGERRLLARSHETIDKMNREDRAAGTVLAGREYAGRTEAELYDDWENAFANGDVDRLDSLTNVISSRYGSGGANQIAQRLATSDIVNNPNARRSLMRLRDNMEHNSSFAQNMRNKASDAYQMITTGGIIGRDEHTGNLQYGNLDHFSANNPIATDLKDWSTQSAATLRRAINSGALTDDMVESLLSSTDPAIQSGIQSDPGKRDVLQARLDSLETNPGGGVGPILPDDEGEAARRYRERHQQDAQQAAQNEANAAQAERARDLAQRQAIIDGLNEINRNLHHRNGRGGDRSDVPLNDGGDAGFDGLGE